MGQVGPRDKLHGADGSLRLCLHLVIDTTTRHPLACLPIAYMLGPTA
jgi:hypothetical protein